MLLVKEYTKLKQAENYQNKLYNKYHKVDLISFPKYTEQGLYIWEVV